MTVDLGLDSDTDNSTTNKVNNDANCKIPASETTEVPPQERLSYTSMVREVRHLYKKAMPSGYRSIESRQKNDANLGISPTSSPQHSAKSQKVQHIILEVLRKKYTHIRLETAIQNVHFSQR